MSKYRLGNIQLINTLNLLLTQLKRRRLNSLINPLLRAQPKNRRTDKRLRQDPRNRNHRHRHPPRLSNLLNPLINPLIRLGHRLPHEPLPLPLTPLALPKRLPRPRQEAHGDRTPRNPPHAELLARRVHFALLLAVARVVQVLHRDELGPPVHARRVLVLEQLVRPHRRRPDIPHLARLYDIVQRLHGLLDRRVGVEAVDLQQVHIVQVEALKTSLHALENVFA